MAMRAFAVTYTYLVCISYARKLESSGGHVQGDAQPTSDLLDGVRQPQSDRQLRARAFAKLLLGLNAAVAWSPAAATRGPAAAAAHRSRTIGQLPKFHTRPEDGFAALWTGEHRGKRSAFERSPSRGSLTQMQFYGGGPNGYYRPPNGLPPGGGGFDTGSIVGAVVSAGILYFLVTSGVLGFLFNGVLILIVAGIVAVPIGTWWLNQNVLDGTCPECSAPTKAIKGQTSTCMYCGARHSSQLSNGVFLRAGVEDGPSVITEPEVDASSSSRSKPTRSQDVIIDAEVVDVEVIKEDK